MVLYHTMILYTCGEYHGMVECHCMVWYYVKFKYHGVAYNWQLVSVELQFDCDILCSVKQTPLNLSWYDQWRCINSTADWCLTDWN
jgi:hypothetical protein